MRRRAVGFNLAFLDVMSCGLGAVLLLFLLIKHNVDTTRGAPQALSQEIQTVASQQAALAAKVRAAERRIAELRADDAAAQAALAVDERSAAALAQAAAEQQRANEQAQRAAPDPVEQVEESIVPLDPPGEEDYLIGLKVEGEDIAILLDASASMTDEAIIDIISRKVRADAVKQQGPKWLRTKRIVRWLLARLPADGRFTVVAYNDRAHELGGAPWSDNGDAEAVGGVLDAMDALVPSGATNLHAGLSALQEMQPPPSHLYVITDGLPTTAPRDYAGVFSSCRSLKGTKATISGACRLNIFRRTIRNLDKGRQIINVILLPMEGDPEAAPAYWGWSAAHRGLLFSPAAGWP